MTRIAAFTAGISVPSARFRVRQYIPALRTHGVEVREFASRVGAYPPAFKPTRPLWAAAALAERLPEVALSYRYDRVWLQREFLSTLATLEPLTKAPRVLDVDDAIWLKARWNSTERLARSAQRVICGNSFLAEQFSRWNRDVVVLPTAVDTERFCPAPQPPRTELRIGWTGLSSTLPYLCAIEEALARVLEEDGRVTLVVVADRPPRFFRIPRDRWRFVRWRPEIEAQVVQDFDIGLMPLRDSLWERGKCSFKMLTYMGCGVPVVVSPVGMNAEVLAQGEVGLAASSPAEWSGHLRQLLADPALRARMGAEGRRVVEEHYSVHAIAPRLAAALAG